MDRYQKRPRPSTSLNDSRQVPKISIGHFLSRDVLLGKVETAYLIADNGLPLDLEPTDALVFGERNPPM